MARKKAKRKAAKPSGSRIVNQLVADYAKLEKRVTDLEQWAGKPDQTSKFEGGGGQGDGGGGG